MSEKTHFGRAVIAWLSGTAVMTALMLAAPLMGMPPMNIGEMLGSMLGGIVARDETPWRTVEGIEFRSLTVAAYEGKDGPCIDRKHAVIYRGPFREVTGDDGHVHRRGERTAVCEKTFSIFSREPYRAHVELVPPRVLSSEEEARPFPGDAVRLVRDPRETKGDDDRATTEQRAAGGPDAGDDGRCC